MKTCTMMFGLRSTPFDPSTYPTVGAAWKGLADELGGDPSRRVTITSGCDPVDSGDATQAGRAYSVAIAHGDKGARD